ncbi:MAG: hypothetical protein KBC91_06830 [Candidatus Omnitrophica bacterium]|nr:hypothetical protein [Candidatus Omnitrophota bacterium]
MQKYFFLIGSLFLILCSGAARCLQAESASFVQGFMPANDSAFETNPYYRKVVGAIGKPLLFEKAKILYVIGQVRAAPHNFERGGEVIKGPAVASYLLKKYGEAGANTDNAETFIASLNNGVSMTEKAYYGLDVRGRKRSMPEVLMSELYLLNQKLRDSDLRGIRYRMIHPDKEPPA